jgi:hypothetical protein
MRRGALIGALSGLVLGALLGIAFGLLSSRNPSEASTGQSPPGLYGDYRPLLITVAACGGGFLGLLFGLGVGSFVGGMSGGSHKGDRLHGRDGPRDISEEAGRKRAEANEPSECLSCGKSIPADSTRCANCGWSWHNTDIKAAGPGD